MGHILGPDPHGMDPKIGPKIGPGRILIKPEALLRDIEYIIFIFSSRIARLQLVYLEPWGPW